MSNRLEQFLGKTAPWILDPKRALIACISAWVVTLPLTWHHPLLAFLGFVSAFFLCLAFSIELPILESFPLPPLTVLSLGLFIRCGLGPIFLAVAGSGADGFVDVWVRYGPKAQGLWLIFFGILICLSLWRKSVIYKISESHDDQSWLVQARLNPSFSDTLKILAILLSLYFGVYLLLSFLSGALDRQGLQYVAWTRRLWRLDTPVAAFSRFKELWFFLVPLWMRLMPKYLRMIIFVELLLFFSIALLSGSRGLLFYPLLMILCGSWLVLDNTRLLRKVFIFFLVLVITLSPVLFVVRDSVEFQLSRTPIDRFQSAVKAVRQPELILSKMRWIGRDLYACHDPFLFTPENKNIPLAGSTGLASIFSLWIPRHLNPHRPIIFDGHILAKRLQRITPSHWSDFWFPCLSLPADLYRRWSLPGVVIGSLLVSLLTTFVFGLWYRFASLSGSTFRVLVYLFPVTYLQSFPYGTSTETAWYLLWEFPKYIVAMFAIGLLADKFIRSTPK